MFTSSSRRLPSLWQLLRPAGRPPDAIPWLKLQATTSGGPGILNGVTYIQRVNTTGGKAPATPGAAIGEEARVYYTRRLLRRAQH